MTTVNNNDQPVLRLVTADDQNPDAGVSLVAPKARRYGSVAEVINHRRQMLINFYSGQEYSNEWRLECEALLEGQERGWRTFVLKRSIPKDVWAEFRELRDHINRQIGYAKLHGSFKQHIQGLMPANAAAADIQDTDAASRALAERLQSVKLMNKDEVPTSVTLAVKLLRLSQSNSPKLVKSQTFVAATEMPDAKLTSQSGIQKDIDKDDIEEMSRQLDLNVKKRTELAKSLSNFYQNTNWQNTDWTSVEALLNVVSRQWKAIGPAPLNRDMAPVQKTFKASFVAIKKHLDAEYNRNAIMARQLVDLSNKLNARETSADSVDGLLDLHQRMQALGVMRVSERSDHLPRIQANISAVSGRRKHQLMQLSEWRATRAEAVAIIVQIDKVSEQHGNDLLNSYSDVESLIARFELLMDKLSTLPQPIHRGAPKQALRAVFLHKQAKYLRVIDGLSKDRRVESLEAYHEASRLIGNAETTLIASSKEKAAKSIAMALDYMSCVRFWPLNGHELLQNRLSKLQAAI